MFTKKDFLDNEKDNEHTQNVFEHCSYSTYDEFKKMKQIMIC